jgi:hypothetical protein
MNIPFASATRVVQDSANTARLGEQTYESPRLQSASFVERADSKNFRKVRPNLDVAICYLQPPIKYEMTKNPENAKISMSPELQIAAIDALRSALSRLKEYCRPSQSSRGNVMFGSIAIAEHIAIALQGEPVAIQLLKGEISALESALDGLDAWAVYRDRNRRKSFRMCVAKLFSGVRRDTGKSVVED